MRRMLRLALVISLVAAASGCGGSKKASGPATTAATTAAATPTTTSGAATSTPSFKSAHNCAQLASLGEQVAKSLQSTSGDLKGTIDKEDQILQAMANAVPSEIRGDFQTFQQAFHQYLQAISKLNIKAGSVPSADQIAQLTSAAKAFSSPKLQAAEQHLSAWAGKNCGGVAPTTTG
jgi:hypothetical protein